MQDNAGIDAAAVRAYRLAAGLTQAQAADLVNLKRSRTWQEWEAGARPPDVARIRLFRHLAGLERLPFGTIGPGVGRKGPRPGRGRRKTTG
ncbi:MAG: helix-turn-helix domain-containing protein [Betaproteobacteria bacterium]